MVGRQRRHYVRLLCNLSRVQTRLPSRRTVKLEAPSTIDSPRCGCCARTTLAYVGISMEDFVGLAPCVPRVHVSGSDVICRNDSILAPSLDRHVTPWRIRKGNFGTVVMDVSVWAQGFDRRSCIGDDRQEQRHLNCCLDNMPPIVEKSQNFHTKTPCVNNGRNEGVCVFFSSHLFWRQSLRSRRDVRCTLQCI